MDRFPAEILLAILSYLPQRDLLAASLTCRKFRNLSRSTIFETLCLYGERDDPLRRERTVEFSGLDKAVDELIAWDIAKHVKTVKFCPKYYIDGMWMKYRDWLEEQGPRSAFSNLQPSQQLLLEENRTAIDRSEMLWSEKIVEQNAKKDSVQDSLIRLFRNMPKFRNIEFEQWVVHLADYGIQSSWNQEASEQYASSSIIWRHLEVLGSALHALNLPPQELSLCTIDVEQGAVSPGLQTLFGSLTSLSFNIEGFIIPTDRTDPRKSAIAKLIRIAAPTLQKLEFRNSHARDISLPDDGELYLNKFFFNVDPEKPSYLIPLVFPKLRNFTLRSMKLNPMPLIVFLPKQPCLENIHFYQIFFTTKKYRWANVVRALPPSAGLLSIDTCGHDLRKVEMLYPFADPFPESTGWYACHTYFKESLDQERQKVRSAFRGTLPSCYYGHKSEEDWEKEKKMTTQRAIYYRDGRGH